MMMDKKAISLLFLPDRAVLRLEGADRRDFLQGLITNDVDHLERTGILYACLLNAQGRHLADFFLMQRQAEPDIWYLDVDTKLASALVQRLMLYKLRADVKITDASADWGIAVAWDANRPEGGSPDPRLPALGWRYLLPRADCVTLPDGCAAYDSHRLHYAVPQSRIDLVPEKSLMLDCNLDHLHALDWKKGCYMGQEVTARMHYRALVKKRLLGLHYTGGGLSAGAAVLAGETAIGTVSSSRDGHALALIRLPRLQSATDAGTVLSCEGKPVTLFWPDYLPK